MSIVKVPATPYRRTPWWRRLLAFGGLGVMGIVLGVILAVVVGAAITAAFLVLSGTAR